MSDCEDDISNGGGGSLYNEIDHDADKSALKGPEVVANGSGRQQQKQQQQQHQQQQQQQQQQHQQQQQQQQYQQQQQQKKKNYCCLSFSDNEIEKFLKDRGFDQPTSTGTSIAAVEEAQSVVSGIIPVSVQERKKEDDHPRDAASKKEEQQLVFVLLVCLVGMSIEVVLAHNTGRWGFQPMNVWVPCMVVLHSVLFSYSCLFVRAGYAWQKYFTELVHHKGVGTVVQTVEKQFPSLLGSTTYHLLLQYTVDEQVYLTIAHVNKAEYEYTHAGDEVSPLRYIAEKPHSGVYCRPQDRRKRRYVVAVGALCTIFHFLSLHRVFVSAANTNEEGVGGGDHGMDRTNPPNNDRETQQAWYFLYLTIGGMLFAPLVLLVHIVLILRRKLEDYIKVQEAIAVDENDMDKNDDKQASSLSVTLWDESKDIKTEKEEV